VRKARPKLPTLSVERDAQGLVAGVDEAGCAPLAGPVVAAAVIFPKAWRRRPRNLEGLTDSKQLIAANRERFYDIIRSVARVGIGAASAREVDRLNIRRAALRAMERAVARLGPDAPIEVALVDGNQAPDLPCPVRTVVKGDTSILSIAAASVIAKVTRDRLMGRLAKRYPGYHWSTNQGYGTDAHYLALLRTGPTPHHRRSFAPLTTLFGGADERMNGLRFAAGDAAGPVSGVRLIALRNDLKAVFDDEACHVGILKAVRWRWMFKAVGYGPDGAIEDGGGRLAAWHNRAIEEPDADALMALFTAPVAPAAE